MGRGWSRKCERCVRNASSLVKLNQHKEEGGVKILKQREMMKTREYKTRSLPSTKGTEDGWREMEERERERW